MQTYNLRDGLKEFGDQPGEEGYEAAFKEVKQLHGRKGLQPTKREHLTEQEQRRALEAVTVMLRKRIGLVKSRTCANGSKQTWLSKEEISSPTVSTEAVILTSLIDAMKGNYTVMADVPNAFIQADLKVDNGEPRTVLVLRGSSTEAELVAVDDGIGTVLWAQLFLEAQDVQINGNVIYQDNKSAILLEKNGKASSSKRTRHLNIRYFFVIDQVAKGNLTIQFCPTDEMIADYFTKPTTGTKFKLLRAMVMGSVIPTTNLLNFVSTLQTSML